MRILICEDNSFQLKVNKALVDDYVEKRHIQNTEIVLKSGYYPEKEELPDADIAILDIDLKDSISGLEIAQLVKERNPYVALIFITNFSSFALDACKLHSCGFLQKPVGQEEFNDIFTRAMLQLNGLRITRMNRMINFTSKIAVREKSIYYIEKVSGTKDIKVTTGKETFLFRGTIKDVQKKLCSSFIKISRTVLINTYYVFKIHNGVIQLSNEKVFPISPNTEKKVKALCSRMNAGERNR